MKSCETCRFCQEWHKRRRSCFSWIPDNHICVHHCPQECGPRSEWQHWHTKVGMDKMTDEEYWEGSR